ncbi:MAG TPA: response regulator [Candidatus Saccharimonadales bacterium]|nr:response regulator [Candidatus Saccharimonadales bacterium]
MALNSDIKEVSQMMGRRPETLNILLVEDSVMDARFITGLLKGSASGFKWRHVVQLAEALSLLKSIRFDIILLDLNLEDSFGHETFARILSAAPSTAILVLSASDDEELAIRTVREGAQDYLVKGSFDRRLLLRSIHYAYERKQSEEALRQSEATVRSIFENSLDGIIITENQGFFMEANSAAGTITGLPHDALKGRSLFDFLGQEQENEWRTLRDSGSGRTRFRVRRNDGAKRLVECGFSANILPGCHLMVLHDITEQQDLEERLRQSQKMEAVGRLAGGVAHDFNNLLGVITVYAEQLHLSAVEPQQRLRAEKIMNATDRAAALTKQLLAFGRRQVLSPKLLDLAMAMADITNMVESMVEADVQLKIRVQEEGLGLVYADQGQIEQVILNLAINGRDAMSAGGVLSIEIKSYTSPEGSSEIPPGEYVLLSVADTGVGMDDETKALIFEPFFTTKEMGKGTGLGLATVYGIVKQSNGHITVHSEKGVGSTFNIYLPRAAVTESAGAMTPKHVPERISLTGTETILLVDDENDLRNATAEYLAGCGYKVLDARDGREAIELSGKLEGNIDLLISDIVMPNVNGRTLVNHMRETRPTTRVLLISGYTDDAIIRHGIFLENAAFLQKPFTFQLLSLKIRALLDERTQ